MHSFVKRIIICQRNFWENAYTVSRSKLFLKSPDITRVVIGWKSVLKKSTMYKAELKLSRHLPDCAVRSFPGLFFSFFWLIESEFSEQASRQVATEEPKKNYEHA